MAKKNLSEVKDLYSRYTNLLYDFESLIRTLENMVKNAKGLCVEDRLIKYTSKIKSTMGECDQQRFIWENKILREKSSKD